jgi:ketosteroid isomerase-like protein
MTSALETTEELTARVVTEFFDAYRRHDVVGMADLCSDNADFSYPPFEISGKQRVIHGDGKVHTIGRVIWTGLIHSFPDLTNDVTTLSANSNGDAIAEVLISGTQAATWGVIANKRQAYEVPHLFVFHVGRDGLIDDITGYWDNASLYRQLGHAEID